MKGFRWCAHCGSPHGLEVSTCPETGEPLDHAAPNAAGTKSHGMLVDGRYRVGRRLGSGPSGIVYEAQQLQHGWTCAIKLVRLPKEHPPEPRLTRARDDARILSASGHPNICVLSDLGTLPDGTLFFVMDRLRGAPLKIPPEGMPEEEVRAIALQILSALHLAHEAGVVHEDLKPGNVFLVPRPACPPLVKLLDFGGYSAKTARYLAPEALAGKPTDRRADLWSCGVLLYRMLTGHRPYDEREIDKLLEEYERRPLAPPTALRPGIAPGWDNVIRFALTLERRGRYADALEFAEALPVPRPPDTERELLPVLNSIQPPSSGMDVIPDSSAAHDAFPLVPRAPRTPGDPLGSVIAKKYRLDALLGTGAAGAVYRGIHVDLDRPVAVKILHPQNRSQKQFVQRFRKEARVVSQLDHANITRVLDFGEDDGGLLYLVMEYVGGQSLESVLVGSGRLPIRRGIDVGIQICNALVVAHDSGIVHRDIKPDNILLVAHDPDDSEPSDLVKVCDFGTAKMKVGDGDLTGVRMLFGSPAYMSPEQARCEELDQRSDLYSLGVTLYEAVLGQLPILGTDLADHLTSAQTREPTRPSELLPEIDPVLEDVLLRLLEKDPAKRHGSARELRAELKEVATQLAPGSSQAIHVLTMSKAPPS